VRTTTLLAVALLILGFARSAAASTLVPQGTFGGGSGSFLGYSVDVYGTTAVVGAFDDAGGAGAAYVYVLAGSSWVQQQVLHAPDGVAGDEFGYEVAVSGDVAMIGAAGKASGQGSVYVFTRNGNLWTYGAQLTASGGAAGDCFGCAIALRSGTALIGASAASGGAGAAYVFTGSGATWQQRAAFAGAAGEYFGFSVALAGGGLTGVVGAFESSSAKGRAVVLASSGATWSQQAVLTASDGVAGDRFGYAVAIDGSTALVGAYAASAERGAAYVFSSSGAAWSQSAKLAASDGAAGDELGYSVALSGTTALVGAYEKAGTTGAAYVFSNAGAGWSQSQELTGQGAGDSFGYAVAVSAGVAVVGAFSTGNDAGAVTMYGPAATAAPAMGTCGVAVLAFALVAAALASGRRRRVVAFALAASLAALGCAGGPDGVTGTAGTTGSPAGSPGGAGTASGAAGPSGNPADMGAVGMELELPGGAQIPMVEWSITGPNGASSLVQASFIKVDAPSVEFLVDQIPPGAGYQVSLSGSSADGGVGCSGGATFSISARATTMVYVQLACTDVSTGSTTTVSGTSFNCAAIGSVTATPLETTVGHAITVAATATGPSPSAFTYAWSASSGAFGSPHASTSSFTCKAAGPTTVTVVVGDGEVPDGSSCNSSLDTASFTVTCAPATNPPPAPAAPPVVLVALVAAVAAAGAARLRSLDRQSIHNTLSSG
jgi:hypothetical protein